MMRASLFMYRKIFFTIFFFAVLAAGANNSRAQGIYLGIAPALNFVHYNTSPFSIPNYSGVAFENGSGIAPLIGIPLEIGLGEINTNFIIMELYYDSKSAKFSGATNTMSASLSYLVLNIGYKYNFTEAPEPAGPGLQLTTYVGYKLSGRFHSDDNNFTTPINKAKTLRFGLRGQLSYDIPFFSDSYPPAWMIITPFVGYDYPFTKVDRTDRSWSASSIYSGIIFEFPIYYQMNMPM
jgi:hypothetical protein